MADIDQDTAAEHNGKYRIAVNEGRKAAGVILLFAAGPNLVKRINTDGKEKTETEEG